MIVYPHAKINLGLRIVSKRADGFHDLETLFYPIDLKDILEILEDESAEKGSCAFSLSGMNLEDDGNNLCVQAYQLLHKEYTIPAVKMHLHKTIPVGAGLGGGSSDAAFTIRCLNEMFDLGLSISQMKSYAAILGSDCAFFIEDSPAFATGRGELLENFDASLQDYYIVLINPGIHVSTAMAYGGVRPRGSDLKMKDKLAANPKEWRNTIVNDFEAHIFEAHPEIKAVKDNLYDKGAVYAAMSGSGSSVFGIFKTMPELTDFPASYFCKKV